MKKVIIISMLLTALFLISGCDGPPLSDADANRMMQETLGATQLEMAMAMANINSSKGMTRGTFTDSYSNGGSFTVNVTGTTGDTSLYPITWDGDITFTDFTTSGGSVMSGTVSLALQMSGPTNFSFSYNGDLTIEFEGTTYDVTWDITYASSVVDSTMTISYTGVFIVNGYEYTYSFSTEQEAPITR